MTRFGYFLSSEEYDPASLIKQAVMAQQAGFDALWISDHFHPWLDEQGQSSFVWSVIGAISQVTDLPMRDARGAVVGGRLTRCSASASATPRAGGGVRSGQRSGAPSTDGAASIPTRGGRDA